MEREPPWTAGDSPHVQQRGSVCSADLFLRHRQRRDCRMLPDAGRAGRQLALHLRAGLDDRHRPGYVADPKTGHGEGLGEAVHRQRPVRHAFERSCGTHRGGPVSTQATARLFLKTIR